MKKLALLITIFGSLIATKEFLIFMENQRIKKYNEINKHNNKFLSKKYNKSDSYRMHSKRYICTYSVYFLKLNT